MTAAKDPDTPARKLLADLSPEDFDGHVDFHKWSPEDRLDWLGQVIAFQRELRGAARRRT